MPHPPPNPSVSICLSRATVGSRNVVCLIFAMSTSPAFAPVFGLLSEIAQFFSNCIAPGGLIAPFRCVQRRWLIFLQLPPCDILFAPSPDSGALDTRSLSTWRSIIHVNLCVRLCLRHRCLGRYSCKSISRLQIDRTCCLVYPFGLFAFPLSIVVVFSPPSLGLKD